MATPPDPPGRPAPRHALALWTLACALAAGCGTALPVADRLADASPAASTLRTLDGEPVDLRALAARHRATVLAWWSPRCPCVRRYHARMEALRAGFEARGVAFVAVASNADDSPAELRRAARSRGLRWRLLRDPHALLATRLGAGSTPTVILLDRAGRVRFRGWIDNEHVPGDPARVPWLRPALEAVLGGGPVARARSPVYGCPITRRPGAPRPPCAAPRRSGAAERCHGGPTSGGEPPGSPIGGSTPP